MLRLSNLRWFTEILESKLFYCKYF